METKSKFASKVNWTQVVAAAAAMLVLFGIEMDAETQAAIVGGIVAAQGVVTAIFRTWFTDTKLT